MVGKIGVLRRGGTPILAFKSKLSGKPQAASQISFVQRAGRFARAGLCAYGAEIKAIFS
jgi:hypothetical protein